MGSEFCIQDLAMEGVKVITPFYQEDQRGFFMKDFEKDVFQGWGLDVQIQEEFETCSKKRVIRGLHFQTKNPQAKLVRVVKGAIHDVIVDLRKGYGTFGKYMDILLSEENHKSLWIPAGFAHGFEVVSEEALMSYKCIGKYLKEYDTGIRWDDGDIGVKWITEDPIVTERDASLMSFSEFVNLYTGL